METRILGHTGIEVTPIGFGAFKIGRNQGTKYPDGYELPDETQADLLLNEVLDMGIRLIDTAPAYGLSEERIGRALAHRRDEFVLSTKVGERFTEGLSSYDFAENAVRNSLAASLRALRTDFLDIVFVHSDGRDQEIIEQSDILETLNDLKEGGIIGAIGFSGKTIEGARAALPAVDVLMVPFNLEDRSHAVVIAEAADAGVGIIVKKGLASGHLPPADALRFVLETPGVSSVVIGSLSVEHLREAVDTAEHINGQPTAS